MHYHLTRRDLLNHVVGQYYFSLADAQKISGYLESSGQISFSGAMFLVNNPSAQDAKLIEGLALGTLGRAPGGSNSYYRIKAYLDDTLRFAQTYPANRGLTSV